MPLCLMKNIIDKRKNPCSWDKLIPVNMLTLYSEMCVDWTLKGLQMETGVKGSIQASHADKGLYYLY